MAVIGPRAGLGLGALAVGLVACGGLLALRRVPGRRAPSTEAVVAG